MQQQIKNLHISNYKSIDKLDLNCERINVFVGEPNTGKSNILEALDLSYLSWMMAMNDSISKVNERNVNEKIEAIDLKKYYRVDDATSLFHLGNINQPIIISHPEYSKNTYIEFKFDKETEKNFFDLIAEPAFTRFDKDFNPINPIQFFASPIKPYRYKSNLQFHDTGNYLSRLMPPYGNNLKEVIRYNNDLRKFISDFATDYGFDINLDSISGKIIIQIRLNEGVVFSLPFEALADTFKRMLFYIAAVKHNNASVITLDEPDTHAFPNYVSLLADEIIKQKNNQFFITTHNPYLLNQLIEQTPKGELAVFVCGFNKLEKSTFANKLTEEDLSELIDYGVDIFFNLNRYLNDGIEYSA